MTSQPFKIQGFILYAIACVVLALPLVGCGKKEPVVPVSGVATYQGKPLVECVVFFTPIDPSSPDLCITSAGKTDAEGRFTLMTTELKARPGAVVGKHAVSFKFPQWGTEDADDVYVDKSDIPNLPAEYTSGTKVTFEVPAKGTSEANFDLE
ncbi:MAG: hypothetical protein Q4G03_10395 [Planctomycetia bacterium]|nr:hypothetical protein [Planctomycetia bacterium]